MNPALIVVDIQNDFLPQGALAVQRGDEVIPVANRLLGHFKLRAATQDWHPSEHQSFASLHWHKEPGDVIDLHGLEQVLWPDHCIQDTYGAEFASDLELGDAAIFQKGTDPEVDSYSGFFDNGKRKATGLDVWLRRNSVSDVYVCGLATDYCVKFTALDAVEAGFRTHVISDGCRGVELNAGDVAASYKELRNAGVRITKSDELIRKLFA